MDKPEEGYGLSGLIEALQIFKKYEDPMFPTCCEHDILHVAIDPEIVSEEDKRTLEDKYGFSPDGGGGFASFRFGNC